MDRDFPMRDSEAIPWSVAVVIYGAYCQVHGHGHTLEEIARRGGWTWPEVGWILIEASRVGWIPKGASTP